MKTMQQLSSFTMGRMLLHVVCAVLRPAHLSWHWQGIRRELLPSVQRLALAALAALPGVALAQFGPSFLSAPDGNPTNALIVANGGNIGIGTTNPADRLVVVGNFLVQGGTAPDFDSSGLRFGNAPEGYRWIQSYDGQPLVLNPLQNRVGIGTTNPGRQLHVVERNGVVAAEFETARETCAIRLNAAGVGGRVWTLESTEGSFNLGDSTANANRFTINTLGKIGIGTTTPQVELDVEGDIAVRSGRELQLNSVDNSVTARINPTFDTGPGF